MLLRAGKYFLVFVFLCLAISWSSVARAQTPSQAAQLTNAISLNTFDTAALDVYLKGRDGKPVQAAAVVTLLKLSNEAYRQETAKAGHVRFNSIAATEYSVHVVASGYEAAVKQVEASRDEIKVVTIELQQLSVEDAAENTAYKALAPKAQKEIGKALMALRSNKVADARSHLDAANKAAPNRGEVQYLYGVYSKQSGNAEQAKAYWMKALEFSPKHLLALLSLADELLRENRTSEALPYATRAIEAEPSSWRAHTVLANVYLRLGSTEESIKQAERAMELGHDQAAMVQPVLAGALAKKGERERAITLLQSYLKEHPADGDAKKLQEGLLKVSLASGSSEAGTAADEELSISTSAVASLPLLSNWLPPDVDENVPPVDPGASCSLDDVVRKAGKRMQEFVKNVDRFTATENLVHQSIDKFGLSSGAATRRFDYVVSIGESRPGFLSVEEYRTGRSGPDGFPDGVATNGLPALALIFHPFNAKNFEMSCEGLGRWGGGLAWQVHFRQRADRPNVMRAYRLSLNGPSHPVALRGRAWIAADTYQIVRLETDLVAALPEIRLFADHTAIEYGPVHFKNRNVEMWLPQTAEVYYDWRGRRSHRRHSFSNYLLFSVDERQRISEPKVGIENQGEN